MLSNTKWELKIVYQTGTNFATIHNLTSSDFRIFLLFFAIKFTQKKWFNDGRDRIINYMQAKKKNIKSIHSHCLYRDRREIKVSSFKLIRDLLRWWHNLTSMFFHNTIFKHRQNLTRKMLSMIDIYCNRLADKTSFFLFISLVVQRKSLSLWV